ncbi:unnamed protein product, partial [marine sediment metagenome]
MFLSIVVPAHNEEKRMADFLPELAIYCRNHEKPCEIIVVPNFCKDRTNEVAEKIAASFPGLIKVINIKEKVLKGGAVKAGFKAASGDLIGFIDADGATSAKEYNKVV